MRPYSQAISFKEFLFISGQIPRSLESGEIVKGSIEEEVEIAILNLKKVLEDNSSGLDCVLKVTVYLSDMEDYERMNDVYKKYFSHPYPARTCIQARLPFDVKVEIDAIAYRR